MYNAAFNARSDAILNARDEFATPENAASAIPGGHNRLRLLRQLYSALLMLGAGIGSCQFLCGRE
jgi:hypothetical protein